MPPTQLGLVLLDWRPVPPTALRVIEPGPQCLPVVDVAWWELWIPTRAGQRGYLFELAVAAASRRVEWLVLAGDLGGGRLMRPAPPPSGRVPFVWWYRGGKAASPMDARGEATASLHNAIEANRRVYHRHVWGVA